VVDVTQLEKLWHKGPDFEKDGATIPLIFRVATVEDKRPPPGTHTTRRLWQNSAGKVSRWEMLSVMSAGDSETNIWQ